MKAPLLRPAVVLLAALTFVTGVLYPLATTGVATLVFPAEARGSLVTKGGVVVGSSLVGQAFDGPGWFHGRPSAASYDASASSASNLGPTNPALREAVEKRVKALRDESPDETAPIPVDLVTASASGLDPHVSPAAARWQVRRVARERGLPEAEVLGLVEAHVERPPLGVFGEARVNVLALNLALDNRAPRRP